MDYLIPLLTFVEVLVCLLLILIVLMQRPRQEGLGASFGEGVTSQVWGAQTTNVLQKGTGWLAAALFITTLTLAYCISKSHTGPGGEPLFKPRPAATEATPIPTTPATGAAATATPATPAAGAQVSKQPGGTVTVTPSTKPAAATPPAATPAAVAPKADAPKPTAPAPSPAPAAPAKADAAAKAPASAPVPVPAK